MHQIRITAAVAASAAMLALAAPAHAATVSGRSVTVNHNVAITKGTFNVTSRAKTVKGPTVVTPVIRNGEVIASFEAGSTGQGPWSDEACESAGLAMNYFAGLAQEAWLDGDHEGAVQYDQEVEQMEEQALDNGCFIVYREGPPPEPEIG